MYKADKLLLHLTTLMYPLLRGTRLITGDFDQ